MHAPGLIASLAVLATSALLMLLALRGRRVNNHPICRRCGFDLFGKPAESTVCSECGADLAGRKAIRIGRRERRGRVLAAAVPVMLLSAAWSGWSGWRQARRVDWNPHKPAWWLVRDVNGPDAAARDAALLELARRIAAGRLPREREDALVAMALAAQADTTQPWAPAWGTVVEAAHDTGSLAEIQWVRYLSQAVTPVMTPATSSNFRGQRVEFRLQFTPPARVATTKVTGGQAIDVLHVGVYAEPNLLVDGRAMPIQEGTVPIAPPWRHGDTAPLTRIQETQLLSTISWAGPRRPTQINATPAAIHTADPPPDSVTDGRHTARLRLHLVGIWSVLDGPGRHTSKPLGANFPVDVEATWDLRPMALLNPDPAFRAAVEHSLHVDRIVYRSQGNITLLSGTLACRPAPPIALAYRVFIIEGGRANLAGTACFTPGGFVHGVPLQASIDPVGSRSPPAVDIELRPAPDLATPEAKTIWGGEVTLDAIPLVAEDPSRPDPGGKGGR